ncbi:class I SAM-dependent methyltransferase [Sphaerisporangium sp. NPDC049002]|uniref:class I SAM-dependent methyltransferase n=1 Tax=Sphaerisporangium sp. NPDC049002 TaxID=3155392 RepID=UPI0033CFA8CF
MTHDSYQHQHQHQHQHGSGDARHDEAGLADLLDLDAEVAGSYLDEVTEWAARHAPEAPRTIADVGAGTGAGSLALARRFGAAEVVAIDRSALMLERLRAAARGRGPADRLRLVRADLDVAWPAIGAVDLAWAASSLHEFADPERVLRDVHAALNPGGLLVVIEMDALPRFLPDDLGLGRPGLESRCHEVVAEAHWNAHPDWRCHLERAGFEIAGQRGFTIEPSPAPPATGRFARAYLSRIRSVVEGRLAADDLDVLDRLLADDDPEGLLRRRDLTVRGTRTAWAARRP